MTYLNKTVALNVDMGLTNGEIIVPVRSLEALDDELLVKAIRGLADDYQVLKDYMGGNFYADTVEEALEHVTRLKQASRSRDVKGHLTKERRKEFRAARTSLLLALIERDGYICQHPDCNIQDALTIDHIIPLSRGGSDDLTNLRFLCLSHNAKKSDKIT